MNTPISALLGRKGSALHSVTPSMTVAEAVAEMNRNRVGAVVVLDGGKLAGIFTERDVLRRVVGAGVDPNTTSVAAVMTGNVLTVSPETTVDQAIEIFTEKRCRHLPVMADGRLIGLVSIGDTTRWMADAHRAEAEHLKSYIAGGFST
jgi:CBS domain-containing protein